MKGINLLLYKKFINKAISIKHAMELLSCSEKTIKKDGTIRYNNKLYQIDKGQTLYNNKIVIVLENFNGDIEIYSGKVKLSFKEIDSKYRQSFYSSNS